MKGIAERFHFIMSTNESFDFRLGGSLIERSDYEKMLGIKLIKNLLLTNMSKLYAVKLIIN